MVTLYDVIGVRPDASQEQVDRAIEDTRRRFLMTGEMNKSHDKLREVESTLGDPAERFAYNKKLGLPAPSSAAQGPLSPKATKGARPLSKKRRKMAVGALILAVLGFGAYWTFRLVPHVRSFPVGCYLVSTDTGKVKAVLVAKMPLHTFPNGKRENACELLVLSSGKRLVFSEKLARELYKAGEPAPKELWEVGEQPPSP